MDGQLEVLLVEDNTDHVFLTKATLESLRERFPVTIHVVTDGQEAIDYVEKSPPYGNINTPDFILLDIKLPKRDGFEVLEFFKSDARFKTIPIVMLTSSDDEKDIARSYELGSNSYISKPTGTDELASKLESLGIYWFTTNAFPTKSTV